MLSKLCNRVTMQKNKDEETYGEIDGGGDDEGPVAAEMSIGNIGSQNRSHPDGANPVSYIV